MLKLAGSLLIIGATTLWGMAAAEGLRDQYEQMRLLQSLLYALRSEILYARSYLEEAFAKIGETAPEPYRGWLLGMSEIMRQKSGVPFCQIWSRGIQESLRESGLEQEEKDKLSEIGKRLGNADMEAQKPNNQRDYQKFFENSSLAFEKYDSSKEQDLQMEMLEQLDDELRAGGWAN